MKKLTYIILTCTFAIITGCEDEVKFDKRGLISMQVMDNSGEVVSDATVDIYGSEDDWAFEENLIRTVTTNGQGEVIIGNLPEGTYYFDVRKDNQTNWQDISNITVYDGTISPTWIYISESLHVILSDVDGRDWELVRVTDLQGTDLSSDPNYACLTGDILTFTKAGYYGRNDNATTCESGDPSTVPEGSWWAWGRFYLYLLLNDIEVYEIMVWDISTNHFVGQFTHEENQPLLHFERR